VPAGNYGWPVMEGFDCGQGLECEPPEDHIEPRAVYPIWGFPECAIVGGFVYRGAAFPELEAHFVYADYCSGAVWALDTEDETAAPVRLAQMRNDNGTADPIMISSLGLLESGELVFVSYNGEGIRKLERIE
jgi:glucose/arabinose dehydrogenase